MSLSELFNVFDSAMVFFFSEANTKRIIKWKNQDENIFLLCNPNLCHLAVKPFSKYWGHFVSIKGTVSHNCRLLFIWWNNSTWAPNKHAKTLLQNFLILGRYCIREICVSAIVVDYAEKCPHSHWLRWKISKQTLTP